jgi:hypothetical protein
MQNPGENPSHRRPAPPPTETRRCDACGKVTLCVRFPTVRGPNTGALCLDCLRGAVGGLRKDESW